MKRNKTAPFLIESARLTPDGAFLFTHPDIGWVASNQHGHQTDVPELWQTESESSSLIKVWLDKPTLFKPRRGRGGAQWEYLLSARAWEDYSTYDPDRCNNGGGYGYWEDDLLFARLSRARNGRSVTQFAAVRVCRTTADFPYTDSGEFQDQWRTWRATDVEGEFTFTESGAGELDALLEEFPSFRWLTAREVLDEFPVREVSRALLKKGSSFSFALSNGRRVRRVRN